MCKLVEEKYVIQYQYSQYENWYDTHRSLLSSLKEARRELETKEFKRAKKLGGRHRIVKRTTYEEAME